MGRPGLNRRHLLAAAGGFGFAALGAGADALASGARTRVRHRNPGRLLGAWDVDLVAEFGVQKKDPTDPRLPEAS
ncbi:hypothetical protein [Streptomyces sp. NPDC003393]